MANVWISAEPGNTNPETFGIADAGFIMSDDVPNSGRLIQSIATDPPSGRLYKSYIGAAPDGVPSQTVTLTTAISPRLTAGSDWGYGPYVVSFLVDEVNPDTIYETLIHGRYYITPRLSGLSVTVTGPNTATLDLTTSSTSGLIYWFVSTSATPPSAGDLKAGAGAVSSGSQAVTAPGAQSVPVTGLATSTGYVLHALHETASDFSGPSKQSLVTASPSFTSGAAATAPDIFSSVQWLLTDGFSSGEDQISLNIQTLPSDGGAAITAIEYRVDSGSGFGAAQTFAGTGPGVRSITVAPAVPATVQIRAVNSVGAGAWSAQKIATPQPAGAVSTLTGVSQTGETLTVSPASGTDTLPYYLQIRVPPHPASGYAGSDWMLAYVKNPLGGIAIPNALAGCEVRAVYSILNGSGQATDEVFSAPFGPVGAPLPPSATSVSSVSALNAAIANNSITEIILAGGVYDPSQIVLTNRSSAPLTIWGDPLDPPVLKNEMLNVDPAQSITFDGLMFYRDAANSSYPMVGGATGGGQGVGLTFRRCIMTGDAIPASVYENADTTYSGTGMNFMPWAFALNKGQNITLDGVVMFNVRSMGDYPTQTTIDGVVNQGTYFDGFRVFVDQKTNPTANNTVYAETTDRAVVRDVISVGSYGKYNEQSTQSPHYDCTQWLNSSPTVERYHIEPVFEDCFFYGAAARNFLHSAPSTPFIQSDFAMHRTVVRNSYCANKGRSFAMAGSRHEDLTLEGSTMVTGGGGFGSTIRIGFNTTDKGADNGVHLLDSISGWVEDQYLDDTTGYVFTDNSFTQIPTNSLNAIRDNTLHSVPLAHRALVSAIPNSGYEDQGCITQTGHLRNRQAQPAVPAVVGSVSQSGGFQITLTPGADLYFLRYRAQGGGGAWTRIDQTSNVFNVSGLSAGNYEYRAWMKTDAGGVSQWGALETVTAG